MKDIAFGQYYAVSSFVHKMDARFKILLTVAFIVGIFLIREFFFWGYAVAGGALLVGAAFAKVPPTKLLRSVKVVLFFVILSSVLQILFNKNGEPVVSYGFIFITDIGLKKAAFIALRITLIVTGTSLLTLTTTPVELSDGMESLFTPLRLVGFPSHAFAMVVSITLRYIPALMEETERIVKAQKARGVNFESGGLLKRAKALIPILVPLLVSAFRRADELASAMETRCYEGAKGRTKYKRHRPTWRDALGTLAVAAMIVGVCLTNGWLILW